MKRSSPLSLCVGLFLLLSLPFEGKAQDPAAVKPFAIRYQPPKTGAPDLRVGSGTRGGGSTDIVLTVISPSQPGYAASASPRLFWYQSKKSPSSVELYITDIKAMKTIFETKIANASESGFHSFDLTEQKVALKADTLYEWSVTISKSGADRSSDTVTTGAIIYTPPTGAIKAILGQETSVKKAADLAQNGFWYDAYATISDLIKSDPKSSNYVQLRNDLLTQTGLKEATR